MGSVNGLWDKNYIPKSFVSSQSDIMEKLKEVDVLNYWDDMDNDSSVDFVFNTTASDRKVIIPDKMLDLEDETNEKDWEAYV